MAYPRAFRQQLGLSLNHLAELISCTRGQLAMAESGLRKLPDTSLKALATLEKEIEKQPSQNDLSIAQSKKATAVAKQVLKKNTLQLKKRNSTLEQLQEKMKQAQLLCQIATNFEQKPLIATDDVSQLRMKILKKMSAQKVEELAAACLQEKLAIAALEAQINMTNDFHFV